jgi:hypothetical protein
VVVLFVDLRLGFWDQSKEILLVGHIVRARALSWLKRWNQSDDVLLVNARLWLGLWVNLSTTDQFDKIFLLTTKECCLSATVRDVSGSHYNATFIGLFINYNLKYLHIIIWLNAYYK